MKKGNQLKSCYKKMLSSREVVARDLPHLMPLFNEEKQPYFMREAEDPAQKPCGMTSLFNNGNICPTLYSVQKHYGMTSEADRFSRSVIPQCFYAGYSERNVKAFTLIELLVVVLIIGILAAVALPQYQKAVEKSKAVQALTLIKSMANAINMYHLASGEWPASLDDLDIEIPVWVSTEHLVYVTQGEYHSNNDWSLQWETAGSKYLRIERMQGPYRGAGFEILFANANPDFNNRLMCFEYTAASGFSFFTKPAGSYCTKLFQATDNAGASWAWWMP